MERERLLSRSRSVPLMRIGPSRCQQYRLFIEAGAIKEQHNFATVTPVSETTCAGRLRQ